MPPEKTEQYSIPPMIEHLANAAGLNAQMLRETRDYLADSLTRNQQLVLENASFKQDLANARKELDEMLANEALCANERPDRVDTRCPILGAK